MIGTADRLLVDSGGFQEDGAKRLAGMATVVANGISVTDIGWLRLNLWRELLAGLFDHPLLQRELDHIRAVRIDVARPTSTLRISKAAFYLGWLASRLGWEVARPLTADDAEAGYLHGAFRRGRREITVELRPVRTTLDGTQRAAGSLVRVDIEATRPRATVRARITRQADHLLATADWNGAQVSRRAGRLEPFDETPFIAEALDSPGLDKYLRAGPDTRGEVGVEWLRKGSLSSTTRMPLPRSRRDSSSMPSPRLSESAARVISA